MSPEVRGQLGRIFGEGTVAGMTDAQLLDRFVSGRDEVAFSALVSRHGPMVLGICRGVVRDEHDAEDAFQATFLVLARKARSLRVEDSVGGWLHRVGRRIAVESSRRASRRRQRERDGQPLHSVTAPADPTRAGLLAALHEEIDRLPAKYRVPIVLCDLQSFTRDEAAAQLGWPAGTVAGRLARARALLRDRLTRRGLLAAAGALATPRELSAAVPSGWAEKTSTAALGFVSRNSSHVGTASASAISLAEGVMRMMTMATRVKFTLILIPLSGILGAAALAALADPEPKQTIAGKVVGPGGKPADGVRVFFSTRNGTPSWGRVVAETTPDEDGSIRMEVPEAGVGKSVPIYDALWAYRTGSLVGTKRVSDGVMGEGSPVRLDVGPAAYTPFEVRDPDGNPVAGATIEPRVLQHHHLSVPDGLAERIAADTVTDAKGHATLTAFFPEEVVTAVVAAPGFGRLQVGFEGRETRQIPLDRKVVTLLPTGRLKGRLVGTRDEIRGRGLTITVYNAARPNSPAPGYLLITTDDEGRFEVPEIVAGKLRIHGNPEINRATYVESNPDRVIEPGRNTEVELPLRKAVPVTGIIRERTTGTPILGVEVGLYPFAGATVTSDETGRFRGFCPPGSVSLRIGKAPDAYESLLFGIDEATVPEGAKEYVFAPIELGRATELSGIVVDVEGKPVAGSMVEASWIVEEGTGRIGRRSRRARSGQDGRFVVCRVAEGAEVRLEARLRGLHTPHPMVVKSSAAEPVQLRIDDTRSVSMEGKVIDSDGKPLSGAHVHLRRIISANPRPIAQVLEDERVDFDGVVVLVTDADGRYRTPKELDREASYIAYASMPGRVTVQSAWIPASDGTFPDLTLRPER